MTTEEQYITHLKKCFENAENGISKISQEIIEMEGMTGTKTRHFYNNLLSLEGAKYLEVGAWKGSSTCAAMFGNNAKITVVDNFSEFGCPKQDFLENTNKYRGDNKFAFIEDDCFSKDFLVRHFLVDDKFNMYLYDGHHSEDCQYKALNDLLPLMKDVFIYIADDANWLAVRQGTERAIKDNNLEVIWSKQVLLTDDNEFTHDQEEANKGFWNGIEVYLLKKQIK